MIFSFSGNLPEFRILSGFFWNIFQSLLSTIVNIIIRFFRFMDFTDFIQIFHFNNSYHNSQRFDNKKIFIKNFPVFRFFLDFSNFLKFFDFNNCYHNYFRDMMIIFFFQIFPVYGFFRILFKSLMSIILITILKIFRFPDFPDFFQIFNIFLKSFISTLNFNSVYSAHKVGLNDLILVPLNAMIEADFQFNR